MNKNMQTWLIVAALSAFIVGAAIYSTLPSLTVISVSKVNIDPTGYEDAATGEWRGSFWVIAMLVSTDEDVASLSFANPTGESGGTFVMDSEGRFFDIDGASSSGEELIPTSSITITINPVQPYWERAMEVQSVQVVPVTSGAWSNAFGGWGKMGEEDAKSEALFSKHMEWGVGNWELHTPFEIKVWKNEEEIGSEYIDTVGGVETVRIPETGDEYIHLTNLGKLGTGYEEPQIDIIYFNKEIIYEKDAYARSLIEYDGTGSLEATGWDNLKKQNGESYSAYWFGPARWDDSTPAGFTTTGDLTPSLLNPANWGGWADIDGWKRKAVTPAIYAGNKQAGTEAFMSLTEYLDSKIDRITMPSYGTGTTKMTVIDKKMKIYMPYGAASSLVTLKISTELADTIVWKPKVANFELTWANFGDIADRKTSPITVKCLEGEGSGTIFFTKDVGDMSINPPTIGTGSMKAGDVKTFDVEVLNLGEEADTTFTVTAEIQNSIGTVTDTATATGTLLEKTGALTVLSVLTTYSSNPVSGIPIVLSWAEQTRFGTTNEQGTGSISWELGSYEGIVDVAFTGNKEYKEHYGSITVSAGVQSTYEIELVKYEVEEDWSWLIWLLIPAAAAIAVLILYKKRKALRF